MGSIELLVQEAARRFDVTPEQIYSRDREPQAIAARQAVAYVLRKRYPMTYMAIAQALDGRHHSTIMHAISVAERRAATDAGYACTLAALLHSTDLT